MVAQAETDRREGRGRLSSFDMLPEEAEEHIAWANRQLRDRAMPQVEILKQFNARIADLGCKPISKGAFSRYSIRVAIETRKLEASRRITDAVLSRMAPGDRSDSTLAAVELLKFRIMSMIMDGEDGGEGEDGEQQPGGFDPKTLSTLALAVQRLSAIALNEAKGQRLDKKDQLLEEQRRRELQAEAAASEAADAAETIAKEAGLSAERVAAIRKGVLGLSS